ncbi:MAG: YdeI/OmpD-associated family protein [Ignavibacteria bacterium]
MKKESTLVDDYISKSTDFAKPILKHLRKLVNDTCPEVEEKMKWSFPHFDYKGEMMCSMASFKQHCAFGFWKASLMKNWENIFKEAGEKAMGHLGQIKSLSDLPADKVLIGSIKEAMKLNDDGIKVKKAKPAVSKKFVVPEYILKAIRKNKKAQKTFEEFSTSHKKEYVEWITEAKTEETRDKRLEKAIEIMCEGKSRHWKYARK